MKKDNNLIEQFYNDKPLKVVKVFPAIKIQQLTKTKKAKPEEEKYIAVSVKWLKRLRRMLKMIETIKFHCQRW